MSERTILDRYQIVRELGSGGMGTVFLARDVKLQRDVAIKMLKDNTVEDQASVERFKREVKTIAGLSHPNVISLFLQPCAVVFEHSGRGLHVSIRQLLLLL